MSLITGRFLHAANQYPTRLHSPILRERGTWRELNRDRPPAGGIGLNKPMRLHDDRLMYEFESALGLTNGFDWKRPNSRWAIERQPDIDAEPFIREI